MTEEKMKLWIFCRDRLEQESRTVCQQNGLRGVNKETLSALPARDIRLLQHWTANENAKFQCNNSLWINSLSVADGSYVRFHSWTWDP